MKNKYTPHDVYLSSVSELQQLLMNEDCFLPSKTRAVSDVCRNAKINVNSDVLRNGQDRRHRIYGDGEWCYNGRVGEQIVYEFEKSHVSDVHIVFDSDLNRETLPGGHCERIHSTRANRLVSSPQMHLPKTLCKSFALFGELDGKRFDIMEVTDNRKRAYHVEINQKLDRLGLELKEGWGEKIIPVISFDFN